MKPLWEMDSTEYSRLNQDISHAFGLLTFEFPDPVNNPFDRRYTRTEKGQRFMTEYYLTEPVHIWMASPNLSTVLLESLPEDAIVGTLLCHKPERHWKVSIISRETIYTFEHPWRAAAEALCYLAYRFDSGELQGIFPDRAEWLRSLKGKL